MIREQAKVSSSDDWNDRTVLDNDERVDRDSLST